MKDHAASPSDAAHPIQTPIHIYVLWHPRFTRGMELAARIYQWFRLDNIEGIPVFFRSTNAKGSDRPPAIQHFATINYVIPLVDAHMASDPVWRQWLVDLKPQGSPVQARKDQAPQDKADPTPKQRLYPVAVDPFAFQVPAELRDLNFIRHDMNQQPSPEMDVLLSVLTEVMCRDLRYHLHGGRDSEAPSKIKIFLSHAKADGTEVVRRLKEHIQSQTQCETFFDETDIPSGTSFSAVLDHAIASDSAGMIAIHGSQYAERPWCRREIRTFQTPRPDETDPHDTAVAFFVPPVVVVENLSGDRVSRSIPELGFAPALRWAPGSERRIVNTLLREILLGFFHRMLIRNALRSQKVPAPAILVNRSPDPLLAQRLIQAAGWSNWKPEAEASGPSTPTPMNRSIYYPGYGLSQVELAALAEGFPHVGFTPLADIDGAEPSSNARPKASSRNHAADSQPGLDRVVRLAVGNSSDILDGGYGDQHNQELLLRLLRPLARGGHSLLYGGLLPKAAGALSAWEQRGQGGEPFVNFTSTCLHVLIAERNHGGDGTQGQAEASRPAKREARLYSMPVWPESEKIDEKVIAEWVDVCSFRPVTHEDLSGRGADTPDGQRPAWNPRTVPKAQSLERSDFDSTAAWKKAQEDAKAEAQAVADHNEVIQACCLTRMRTMVCDQVFFTNLNPHLGGGRQVAVLPIAHVFLGGKLKDWSGIAPGLFEEFAAAVRRGRPIFLIGAGQGAAGAIARWLLAAVHASSTNDVGPVARPPEFTVTSCLAGAKNQRLAKVFDEWKRQGWLPRDQWDLKEILDVIQDAVDRARGGRSAKSRPNLSVVLNNGLSHETNLRLLAPTSNHRDICSWVHEGLRNLNNG